MKNNKMIRRLFQLKSNDNFHNPTSFQMFRFTFKFEF